ncbi:MAG: hypothetical protein RL268_1173 [Pseudomonadota bacterium]|jgi:transposase-like protein
MHYLWRAVDHEGELLESYVTKTRDKAAALWFMRKALKRHGQAEAIVTDRQNTTLMQCANWVTRHAAKSVGTRTTERRIHICPSADENG